MRTESTEIAGCLLVHPFAAADNRGSFTKTFHAEEFAAAGLRSDWREEYYSRSHVGVIRGMHFQLPPADHAKVVFCLVGEVLDVVVDLRLGSPTWHQVVARRLDAEKGTGLYAPSGCAHGFLSLSPNALMLYKVTSVHAPAHDAGIAWASIGFDWPVAAPIVSARDAAHPPLDAFTSPFRFDPANPSR